LISINRDQRVKVGPYSCTCRVFKADVIAATINSFIVSASS
jgi:hypothetical protein